MSPQGTKDSTLNAVALILLECLASMFTALALLLPRNFHHLNKGGVLNG
jgi:hypothetical protein